MNDFLILMKHELAVTAILFLMLFIRIGKGMRNSSLLVLVHILLLLNVACGFIYNQGGELFDGMFTTSPLIAFQKNLLNIAVYLITLVCSGWLLRSRHMPEFLLLMMAALLGMFFMISSGNMLIFYLALELATIPVAAMANFDLEKKASSEGAMKMIMSSAFSSGILLFGISLIYGASGTILFNEIPGLLDGSPVQVLGFILFFSAFAFKLSIVPFHLWTADVYEGSPVATTSFLSVVSKGAAAFLFLSVLYKVFQPLAETWYTLIVILSIATMVVGNLFALRQQNLKRFLAFSSIAQVGFILVGLSANSQEGITSVVFFILVYIFSNLAAFGVIGVIGDATGKESLNDYKGLYKTNPFLCWVMALALFSLAGIPPTAGFFGKFFLITAGAAKGSYTFIIIAALNMIVSLFYYLKVVRAMFMEPNDSPIPHIKRNRYVSLGLLICTAGILLAGLLSWIYAYVETLM